MGQFQTMGIQIQYRTLSTRTKDPLGLLEDVEAAQMHLLLGLQLLMALMLADILLAQTEPETVLCMVAMAEELPSGTMEEMVEMPHLQLGRGTAEAEQMRLPLQRKLRLATEGMEGMEEEVEADTGVERTLRPVIH